MVKGDGSLRKKSRRILISIIIVLVLIALPTYFWMKHTNRYLALHTAMTVTGDEAQHSDLPQNKQIVKMIEEYLLDGRNPNNPVSRNDGSRKNSDN